MPWRVEAHKKLKVSTLEDSGVKLGSNFGQQILILTSMRLSTDGIGLFIVEPSFFTSPLSIFPQFNALGLGLDAALELPSGTFAPETNMPSYLVIVRKKHVSRMFIARLSSDSNTNLQILSNLANGKEGNSLELGRFVDMQSFKGLDYLHFQDRLELAKQQFGAPALTLEELATFINIGCNRKDFEFPEKENSIFIPLIGTADVVEFRDDIKLKPQNYTQVIIDPTLSDAHFVAQFLNSDLGKEIREISTSRSVIPKLNMQTLKNFRSLFLPVRLKKYNKDWDMHRFRTKQSIRVTR